MTKPMENPEILAPAGGPAALAAAVAAGADAAYFGLKQLNARRGAENFLPEHLAEVLRTLHAAGARGYLTLNIDLAQRELGLAARQLELARQSGADAVLVRDPALLALLPLFPELEFHFSTQAGVSSSAGVRAAKALGIRRVVLAREMSLEEIRAASAVEGMETEVFVQGALCFCASGRCLMSSWVGGRSGNRGACTSPCRVSWTINGKAAGRPLSMHDLSLADKLGLLAAAGVRSFKIEGRLKKPEWVAQAVALYRRALDAEERKNGRTEESQACVPGANDRMGGRTEESQACVPSAQDAMSGRTEEACIGDLGAYTGRKQTGCYFDGVRRGLTGTSGRVASVDRCDGGVQEPGAKAADVRSVHGVHTVHAPVLAASVAADAKGGLLWRFSLGDRSKELRTPPQPVKKRDRSADFAEIASRLEAAVPKGLVFGGVAWGERKNGKTEESSANGEREREDENSGIRLPRSTANKLADELAAFLRAAQKEPDGQVRIDLPADVKKRLLPAAPHPANTRTLGERPDRVRLAARSVAEFARAVPEVEIIMEMADAPALEALPDLPSHRLIAALPQVSYEADIPRLEALLRLCVARGVRVEVNSWDGWWLARQCGVRMEAGPGLMALNGLAAAELHWLGCGAVMLSMEADRGQLEDACAAAGAPLSLLVYGRPALMHTRVWFPDAVTDGAVFTDARGGAMRMWRDGWSTLVLRPVDPFDWCGLRNDKIRVAHLVADLVSAPDPLKEWRSLGNNSAAPTFNYARTLR